MGAPHRGPDVGELPLPAERQKCFLLTSPESGRPGWNWHPRGQGTADQAAVRKNGTAKKMRADVSRSHFVVDLGFKASAYLLPTIIRVGHNQLLAPREELKTSGIT